MSFLDELKGFDTGSLNDRETVVKQYIPNVSLADIVAEEQPTEEVYYESPLVEWLVGLGVQGDVVEYANLLLDRGFQTSDDLLLADPSLEDLIDYGFVDEEDRLKVFYEVHPEKRPYSEETALDTEDPMVVFDAVLSKIEAGTATDEDLEIYLRIKASLGHA
eukprot:TRINITY_DN10195_c0_g1_i1.p1 TRINITY_DN10195_c0_g1~~TRINITY_DN10195_c0_g1_i1.p1  ORF type:complete len:162 (-),score=29.77 TRINITY_DN10195_c0_g1_i1:107-592(-)